MIYNTLTVPLNMVYESGYSPPKDTYTPLEIDILPHQILNRRRLVMRHLHQDFVELMHKPLDPTDKLVPAVKELWEDERRRRAVKGLSLSEVAMLPSGGMDGRNMAELGYKVPGLQRLDNRGGNWKRSDEMWEMLQERMETERRKTGKLSFERFSMEAAAGKNGEKRKYDKVCAQSDGQVKRLM
jgi:DNA polymerase zeta